jgi:hypothetical protein
MRLFAFLIITVFAVSQSQPPSPTPTPSRQKQDHKAALTQNQSADNDTNTKQLLAAIEQLVAEIKAEREQEKTAKPESKPSPDWWTKASTVLITGFTGLLAIVAVLQWLTMKRQAGIFHRQAEIANRQTEIGAKQAEIAEEQLSISKSAQIEIVDAKGAADKRYAEQIELAQHNIEAAKESANAAKLSAAAMERSVRLQENTQRQWVDLREWRAYRISITDPLEIDFQITNPTSLPFILHAIVVTVDGKRIDEPIPMALITPNDPIPHSFGVSLSAEQQELYSRNALAFEIECTVLFADSNNLHWGQTLGCRLLCGKSGSSIITVTSHRLYESGVPGERGSRDVELPK